MESRITLPSFKQYGLYPGLVKALETQNIYTPSSIQDSALISLTKLSHNNFYIAAQTGTGKTYAYLLPIFHFLKQQEEQIKDRLTRPKRPRAVILVPSKELSA